MSRTRRYIQRKALVRLPAPALDLVGKAVLQAVDKAVEDRWPRALIAASGAEGATVDERVRSITGRFRRELSGVGAATGAVAAAPGLGTGAAASALIADLGWFAMRSTDLIMTIGAAHGYTRSTVEERRAWVLAVLAFGEEAADRFAELVDGIDPKAVVQGEHVGARLAGLAGGDAATLDALRRVNANLAAKVVAKYGSRRTLLALGKLLPFGVGAAVGGTTNYLLVRVVASQAGKFFEGYRRLRPPPPTGPPLPGPPPPAPAERTPPPPGPSSRRLPNPRARLTRRQRREAIPTEEARR
jgi:hypothetical protein